MPENRERLDEEKEKSGTCGNIKKVKQMRRLAYPIWEKA